MFNRTGVVKGDFERSTGAGTDVVSESYSAIILALPTAQNEPEFRRITSHIL